MLICYLHFFSLSVCLCLSLFPFLFLILRDVILFLLVCLCLYQSVSVSSPLSVFSGYVLKCGIGKTAMRSVTAMMVAVVVAVCVSEDRGLGS